MIRAVVFGITGYTGIELVRILSQHPEVQIVGGSSQSWSGKMAGEVFPFIYGENDFRLSSLEQIKSNIKADVAFLALPHGESAGVVRPLLEAGLKVVDLSADLRLHDPNVYGNGMVNTKTRNSSKKRFTVFPKFIERCSGAQIWLRIRDAIQRQ